MFSYGKIKETRQFNKIKFINFFFWVMGGLVTDTKNTQVAGDDKKRACVQLGTFFK
jgi:hypothetical protein